MKKLANSKWSLVVALVVLLTFGGAGLIFASNNNNGGTSFQTPDVKIKEFREGN